MHGSHLYLVKTDVTFAFHCRQKCVTEPRQECEEVPRQSCKTVPEQQCREVCQNIFWCKECDDQQPPIKPPAPLPLSPAPAPANRDLLSIFGTGNSVKIDTPAFKVAYWTETQLTLFNVPSTQYYCISDQNCLPILYFNLNSINECIAFYSCYNEKKTTPRSPCNLSNKLFAPSLKQKWKDVMMRI